MPRVRLPEPIGLLLESGYDGCWGIESVPRDGGEYGAARKAIGLIKRYVEA